MRPASSLPFLFRDTWLLFIFVTCVNGGIWWRRAKQEIARDATLEKGYRSLIKGWLIYANLPWLVMGIGIVSGAVPSTLSYFNPRNGPFVIAFYLTIAALWIAAFRWLFFCGGAEEIIAHPGLMNAPSNSPGAVKLLFLLSVAFGVAGMAWMIFGNLQVPQ